MNTDEYRVLARIVVFLSYRKGLSFLEAQTLQRRRKCNWSLCKSGSRAACLHQCLSGDGQNAD